MSHWLLRIPLAIIFIQQGLMKIPVDIEEAASYGLSYLVWWFVAYGELLGGLGLIIGGLIKTPNWMHYMIGSRLEQMETNINEINSMLKDMTNE